MSLALALTYAADGWPVFPCKPSDKQPLTEHGFKDATTDERQIRQWWSWNPKAMVGVPAGEASGVWVLDIDNRPDEGKDGFAALAALEAEHGPLPETVAVRTGSGGSHRLFRYGGVEIRNRAGFAPGIDTRGNGGYFIAAGSERSDGSKYEWETRPDEPATAPEWLVDIVRKRRTPERPEPSSTGGTEFHQAYVDAAVNGELRKLIGTSANRNDQLNASSFAIGQFVGAGVLPYAEAEARLRAAAEANGYASKDGAGVAHATIKSGLDAGAAEPRPAPTPRDVPAAANDNPKGAARLPVIDPREWHGKPVPKRDWHVEGMIPRRTATGLSGEGGSGKTEVALQLIASSALQRPWFGKLVAEGPCLYFGGEDEADELHRRLHSIVTAEERTLDDLHGVRLIAMAELDPVLAGPDKQGAILKTAVFDKLRDEVDRLKPTLVIIDPSADVFAGDEISRVQVRAFVAMLRQLAQEFDCAVVLLTHPSLTGINTGTGTSGSTAWRNSLRSALYLEVLRVGKMVDPRRRILRVMKANYGATGEAINIRWDEGRYVLDDGTQFADEAASETIILNKAGEVFVELLGLLTAQGQSLSSVKSAPTYAPAIMVKHPKAKGFTKDNLAAAMQRLLDAKRIHLAIEGPPSRRRSHLAVGRGPDQPVAADDEGDEQ